MVFNGTFNNISTIS